ncbi:MAG: substrate-binding domain-containing protein [Oscillospiraceae bacterium]|nr:substrate-binding domain-containing protein [Oscillospiraceae bacterium]
MKKYISLILVLIMAFSLCACTSNAPEETATPEVTEAPASVDLEILVEQDDSMINTYSLLAVNDKASFVDADGNAVNDVELNTAGADALINWLLSDEGKRLAADYGYAEYGEFLFYMLENAPASEGVIPNATEETKTVRLSTTTSVNDSGLLGYLLPIFQKEYGYEVEVFSAGTGKAIANAKMGNADVILVHAKAQEEAFVEEGFARVIEGMDAERLSYMYNFFVLCGPAADPAGVKSAEDVLAAFKLIADGGYTFVSRGDGSGTHTKELALWPAELGITAEQESFADYTEWYVSSNAGMGVCLTMANEQGAYILSDKATFLTFCANDGVLPEA